MNAIHGHEVINMIIESGESFTAESLVARIKKDFGEDTRYYTCSSEGMTAEELVVFLEQRGKFTPLDDGFTVNQDKVCKH